MIGFRDMELGVSEATCFQAVSAGRGPADPTDRQLQDWRG